MFSRKDFCAANPRATLKECALALNDKSRDKREKPVPRGRKALNKSFLFFPLMVMLKHDLSSKSHFKSEHLKVNVRMLGDCYFFTERLFVDFLSNVYSN